MSDDATPSDENEVIVIDNGSGMCKAGFAGDSTVSAVFPSIVGRPKYNRSAEAIKSLQADTNGSYIGNEAQAIRDMLSIEYPIEHGIIKNWNDMEKIWHHLFFKELRTTPEDYTVLLTEAHLNPRSNREQMAHVMFETFNVQAVSIEFQTTLSMYSNGRTSGIVLESGDGVTQAVPFYEGQVVPNALQRTDLAGSDLTTYLQRLMNENGYSFVTTSDFQTVEDIKEQLCYSAADYKSELVAGSSAIEKSYTLPDGQVITIGNERFKCTELLFKPSLLGHHGLSGIHEMIQKSIMDCDVDVRSDLYSHVIISGGTSMIRGLKERLHKELRTMMNSSQRLRVFAAPERNKSVWLGGSILASLSSFDKMTISSDEYWDVGPSIVHRKW